MAQGALRRFPISQFHHIFPESFGVDLPARHVLGVLFSLVENRHPIAVSERRELGDWRMIPAHRLVLDRGQIFLAGGLSATKPTVGADVGFQLTLGAGLKAAV